MVSSKISRRRVMAGGVLASAMVAAPFVRGAYAAGKLSMGFWDHWVPGANSATEKAVKEWAEKEKVEVQIDFITSQGNKRQDIVARLGLRLGRPGQQELVALR